MHEFGLDAAALVQTVEQVLGEPLHITEADLAAVRFSEFFSETQQEAL